MAADESAVVLLVAAWDDAEADRVADELNKRDGRMLRFDTAEFPRQLQIVARAGDPWGGCLRVRGTEVSLAAITGVFCWHPTIFNWPVGMGDDERQFAGVEARLGVGGLLAGLPGRWVNHPGRTADAEYKPLQLRVAEGCGLSIPPTLLTNDAEAVRRFAAELDGPLVYKPLASRALMEQDQLRVIYTSRVEPSDLDDGRVAVTTHLFQQWVDKDFDVRCTVVGDRVFATAIQAGTERGYVDFRSDYDSLSYQVVEPPVRERRGMVDYLGRLGLSFGAFDFVVTPAGEWVFLECNAAGRWAWIEEHTGAPIATAIADFLTGADHDRDHD